MDEILKNIAYGTSIGAILSGVIYAIKSIKPMKKEISTNHINHDKRIVELEKDSASYKSTLIHFTSSNNDLNTTLREMQKTNIDLYKLIYEKIK